MRELRLIGVHDDGEHLLLAESEDGEERLLLPIDDGLRAAVRRVRHRPSANVDSVPVPDELRPRDVQALLRAGVSVEDVAERAGWTSEKVLRYEGPIRAEREHIADVARTLTVGGAAGRTDATFGQRVERRLDGRGVAADDIVWDSWRSHDGSWTIVCGFPAGGRQRQASWHFDVRGHILEPADDEARWLGEDENAPGLLSSGPAREASVYDVEAEGGLEGTRKTSVRRVRGGRTSATAIPTPPAGAAVAPGEPAERPVDLVAAMRERSKNRKRKGRPTPAQPDFPEDAAPQEQLDTSGEAPPLGSHPQPEEIAEPSVDELGHDPVTGTADLFADLEAEPEQAEPEQAEPEQAEPEQAEPEQAEPAGAAEGADVEAAEAEATAAEEHEDEQSDPAIPDRPSTARKGRPTVPSWDDIMFGRRPGRT